jgi:hypothetical protein
VSGASSQSLGIADLDFSSGGDYLLLSRLYI